MKALKTISAVLLSVAVILSFAACHKKGETVMTVGETKIDSGLYLASSTMPTISLYPT